MGTPSEPVSEPGHQTGWTAMKIMGLVLIVVVVASLGGAGFSYYVLRPAASLPRGQCSNSANNYPTCNTCSSGSTFTDGACYTNCSNTATNPPACTYYPPCSNGATNPPSCNKYPQCSNGGANPPTCTPPCSNGAANPPTCDKYPTLTSVNCDPSTVMSNITIANCAIYVSSNQGPPEGTVLIACSPSNPSSSPSCVLSPSQCPLSMTYTPNINACFFTVEALGPSPYLIINANYSGQEIQGQPSLLNSTGSTSLTVLQPPASVLVGGTAKTVAIVSTVTGITFTSAGHEYRGRYAAGLYNVTLPNLQTYAVTIIYVTVLTQGQLSCNAGTFVLASDSPFFSKNFQC